ncbi:nucleotidyltransferase family protein [Microbacterium allomyrinae]|uniref:Nucleotidyltransferase family protein n=1 Tax=Microbacterium allomyrinae TaxID=2830666 RepID=A0A9X1LYP5_9MICO|nr:nucleotidyltransferase family protein [Microbacterium allomyrinae]MCC2034043.1 nucleotidyltransferase family protein [Microbacterium allomyrinae]
MNPRTVALGLGDSVELAHVWAHHVASERGIRVLSVKGASLAHHGLRDARQSADVDVLVDPSRLDDYLAAVASAGWRERPSSYASRRFTLHSHALAHPDWPCDLDVHAYFPGFLADPQHVFDTLWERRATFPAAHRTCATPDRVAAALILALHSLRGGHRDPRHQRELDRLIEIAALTEDERRDAAVLAVDTGCAATLEDVLPRLGVDAPAAPPPDPAALQLWRGRVAARSEASYFWLTTLRAARWRDRPPIAFRAVWPSDHDLLLDHPDLRDAVWPKLRARAARVGRGLRSLPRSLRVLRRTF